MKKLVVVLAAAVVALYGATLNGWLDLPVMATPANPAAGAGRLYVNSVSGKLACVAQDGSDCMPAAGGAAGGLTVSLGGVTVTGAKYVNPHVFVNSQTDATMYTAPAGKRAMALNMHWYATGTATGNVLAKILVSGALYPIVAPQNNGGYGATNDFALGIILDPGESLTASTQYVPGGADVFASILEFDATSPVRSRKLLAFTSGDNTLYTTPTGKSAMLLSGPFYGFGVGANGTFQNGDIHWVNNTGGGAGMMFKLNAATLASGGFVATATRVNIGVPLTLASGDAVVVNTSYTTGTQIVWINVAEI